MILQFFLVFAFFLILGLPIAYTLGMTAVFLLFVSDSFTPLLISQRVFLGLNSFPLLAIPFFMLAGELMERGQLTEKLAEFAKTFVQHIWGGLGHAIILTAMLFATISGSGSATTAAIGSILYKPMKDVGYEDDYAGALIAASGSLGPVIPPGLAFIVYGVITNTSVAKLFLSGVVPGAACGLIFMVMNYFHAKKMNYPRSTVKSTWKERIVAFKKAVPVLMMPLIIFGGIFGGVFTPTEAACVATVYALLYAMLISKSLKFKDIPGVLVKSMKMTAMVVIIMAFASPVGWAMAYNQLPQAIAKGMLAISDNVMVLLLIINFILIIAGMFMDAFTAIVILAPVFLAVVEPLGITPLMFGLIMCFNLSIGQITPPVAVCLYVGASITHTSLEKISRRIIPFVLVMIAVLLSMLVIPDVFMFLPGLLGSGS
ncbi:MAG: TRAP transporter large permease [Spirochaetales bacterium]|jgi:C4-dicarboxylate transporter DctM subunit|nr:TRAP transporter large permease [Spirochaetales bacterium]